VIADAVFDEGWIVFDGGVEEGFAGEEHDDVFGGSGELGPVAFAGKVAGAAADLLGVALEVAAAGVVVGGGGGVEEGVETGFAVDDDVALAGEIDDQVGLQSALLGVDAFLFDEVAAVGEAGEFDEAAQGDFAPLAANGWTGKSGHEL